MNIIECKDNTYGTECTKVCGNCLSGKQCNHVNGSCPDGCDKGTHGDKCDIGWCILFIIYAIPYSVSLTSFICHFQNHGL